MIVNSGKILGPDEQAAYYEGRIELIGYLMGVAADTDKSDVWRALFAEILHKNTEALTKSKQWYAEFGDKPSDVPGYVMVAEETWKKIQNQLNVDALIAAPDKLTCPRCNKLAHLAEPPDTFIGQFNVENGSVVTSCRQCHYRWAPHDQERAKRLAAEAAMLDPELAKILKAANLKPLKELWSSGEIDPLIDAGNHLKKVLDECRSCHSDSFYNEGFKDRMTEAGIRWEAESRRARTSCDAPKAEPRPKDLNSQ